MSKMKDFYENYQEGFKYTFFDEQSPPSKILAEYMRKNPPVASPSELTGKQLAKWWIEKINRKKSSEFFEQKPKKTV